MKRFWILPAIGAFALLLLPSFASAQRNALKFDVVSPAVGQYNFAYERAIAGRFSAQMGAGFIHRTGWQVLTNGSSVTRYSSKTSGFMLVPELRMYLKKDAPRGLYLQGYARFRQADRDVADLSFPRETDVSFEERTVTVGGGAGLGLHVIVLKRLSLDMNAGPQFKNRVISRNYRSEGVTDEDFQSKFVDLTLGDKKGLAMRAQLALGIAF